MAYFLWFCLGFIVATVLWALIALIFAACLSMPFLPLFMMSHSTEASLEAYKKEHPWAYRWWSFVAWLHG